MAGESLGREKEGQLARDLGGRRRRASGRRGGIEREDYFPGSRLRLDSVGVGPCSLVTCQGFRPPEKGRNHGAADWPVARPATPAQRATS